MPKNYYPNSNEENATYKKTSDDVKNVSDICDSINAYVLLIAPFLFYFAYLASVQTELLTCRDTRGTNPASTRILKVCKTDEGTYLAIHHTQDYFGILKKVTGTHKDERRILTDVRSYNRENKNKIHISFQYYNW